MSNRKQEGMFDWWGACMPKSLYAGGQRTFSVGIFQWIKTADGKRLKKSRVLRRIRGYVHDADRVYADADKICDDLNASPEVQP